MARIARREIELLPCDQRARVQPFAVRLIEDFVLGTRATNARGETYLRCHGRAQFADLMQKFLIEENIGRPHRFPLGGGLTLHDIRSENRLLLIFDANVKRWRKESNRDPDEPLKYL